MGRGGRIAIVATYAAALAGCTLLVDTKGLATGGDAGTSGRDGASADATRDAPVSDGPPADGPLPATYRDVVLADGPFAYYRLGEKSGPTAVDESGNGHHGTYRSGCTFGVPGAIANDSDTAVRFQGSTCAVDAPKDVDFSGTNPFTLEAWALHEGADNVYRHIFNKDTHPPSGGRQQFGVYLHAQDRFTFERWVDDSARAVSIAPPQTGVFLHLVGTYDGTTMRLFIDGELRDTATDARLQLPKDVDLVIGANSSSGQWNGAIDEVAIYAKALDAATVKRHYDLGRSSAR